MKKTREEGGCFQCDVHAGEWGEERVSKRAVADFIGEGEQIRTKSLATSHQRSKNGGGPLPMCDMSLKIMRDRLARAKTPTEIHEASLALDHAMATHEMTIIKVNTVFDEALHSAKILKSTCYPEPLVRKPWYESYVQLTP